jgi:multidrug efflux pump subunit AcrA (membrane-fusion protein)
MVRTFLIPLLAVAGIVFAIVRVIETSKPPPATLPVIEPPSAPFASFVAGSGLVEASTRNIEIGSPVGDVVVEVPVEVGAEVKRGDVLFRLDDRAQRAEVASREAGVAAAESELARLRALPRVEEVPPAEAVVAEARSEVENARELLALYERIVDERARVADEQTRRRSAVRTAEARLADAEARLALLRAGAWESDVAVAEAALTQARAALEIAQVEVERRVVRSPIDGRVLQVNVRVGEFAQPGALATPLMLVGGVETLHVRVDIDENEAWRVRPGAQGVAFVRGNKDLSTAVEFVRYEPFVVPKRSLTGESTERVDTRVLQVIYRFPAENLRVFVGQQMDVYLEAPPLRASAGTEAEAGAGSRSGGGGGGGGV